MSGINPAAVYAAAYNAQAAQAAQPPREPTLLERADAMLMYGEAKAAAQAYRKYLEDVPDDAAAMRSLAIALLAQRRFDESIAVLAMAYEKEPRLARTPIDPAFFGEPSALRRQVNAAVTYANRVNSGSSWLLVAALMQAEGRDDVALRMATRARETGLRENVASEFADVLKTN
jgi:tetratricopeptide (TPR) repeat protein